MAKVHVLKLDDRLALLLQESGLAQQAGDWFQMGQQAAGFYMMALAGEASRRLNAPLTTDRGEYEVASHYFNTEGGTLNPTVDATEFVCLLTPFPRPKSLRSLSLHRLLQIRAKYAAERRRFRNQIQEVAAELSTLESLEAVHDCIADRRGQIEGALQSQREVLDEARVASTWDLLSISVPTLVVAGAAAMAPPLSVPILGAAAVVVGGLNWYGKRRGRLRQAREASPWHYLLSLQRGLRPERGITEFSASMSQLIYD